MKTMKMSNTVTKVDMLNARSSQALRQIPENFSVRGYAIAEDCDSDGEIKYFAYIFGKDGSVYAGNAAAVVSVVNDIIDNIDNGELTIEDCSTVNVCIGKSKGGREFLTLRIG